jgi:hypothetical protein
VIETVLRTVRADDIQERRQDNTPPPRGQHEMAEIAAGGKSGKVVIKNIGLLLSGDIDKPILDADTIVVNDGLIVAVGKEKDCDSKARRPSST